MNVRSTPERISRECGDSLSQTRLVSAAVFASTPRLRRGSKSPPERKIRAKIAGMELTDDVHWRELNERKRVDNDHLDGAQADLSFPKIISARSMVQPGQ